MRVLVVPCLLGIAVPGFAQSTSPAARPAAGTVLTVEHDAPSVGRRMKFNLILPRNYAATRERYPTLYLLHGLTSNYRAWARMRVPEYAAAYDLIVVMPDAGNSWYVNWSKSEANQKNDWDDYITKDLVGYVDKHYRTIAARSGRAINGLSMGGYGAITLGLRHPDMFCSIGSHSGALGFAASRRRRLASAEGQARRQAPRRRLPDRLRRRFERAARSIGIPGFNTQAERTPKGTMFATIADCDAHDPFELVLRVPLEDMPHIYLDCGTGDRLIRSARAFATTLGEHKIPFTYGESAGAHRSTYWSREVGLSMAVQYAILQRNLHGRQAERSHR